jgi:hypothetical protein
MTIPLRSPFYFPFKDNLLYDLKKILSATEKILKKQAHENCSRNSSGGWL